MELSALEQMFAWGFVLAFALGTVAAHTNFCTMGAVSDWVNMGDKKRFRSWMLAVTTAIMGVLILEFLGLVDMSMTTDNTLSNPPYRTPNFIWPRYLLGGFIFGIGMTIGSGCGNKTLLRLGAGNIKSVFTFLAIMAGGVLMIFTDFSYDAFLSWMTPLGMDLSLHNISGQDVGAVVVGVTGSKSASLAQIIAAIITFAGFIWVFKSKDFRKDYSLIFAGLAIGAIVSAAWWVTAGDIGNLALEEADFSDQRPYALGAQSFTFVSPTAHLYQYVSSGFNPSNLTFGMFAMFGVIFGALVYAIITKTYRIEWFNSVMDFVNHVVGGFLMGVGAVLGMGCTIGQGVTGVSTLAMGSFLTLGAIILGSALTMKYQYYRMLYEEASRIDALVTSLVELRMLPAGLRKLEQL